MNHQNQFVITGNLGADPEHYKKSEDSAGLVTFNLAQNVSRLNEKTKKYEQAHTNWFPIRAFGHLGARVKSGLKKGDRVTVFGKIRTYQFEEPGGTIRYGFEVLADDVCPTGILSKAKASGTEGGFAEFGEEEISS